MLYGMIGGVALVAAAIGATATGDVSQGDHHRGDSAPEQRLEQIVQSAITADGPLFTADERALVERKCAMAQGSWDGTNLSMDEDTLRCANGHRVRDREVLAMMERAGPRIAARVEAAMARPEVLAAIDAVAHEATEQALREVHEELSHPSRHHDDH
jgi:hypothetical protein